jgi:hypothetical protein
MMLLSCADSFAPMPLTSPMNMCSGSPMSSGYDWYMLVAPMLSRSSRSAAAAPADASQKWKLKVLQIRLQHPEDAAPMLRPLTDLLRTVVCHQCSSGEAKSKVNVKGQEGPPTYPHAGREVGDLVAVDVGKQPQPRLVLHRLTLLLILSD